MADSIKARQLTVDDVGLSYNYLGRTLCMMAYIQYQNDFNGSDFLLMGHFKAEEGWLKINESGRHWKERS